MPILVSDTSVIIDLERAQLLEEMFSLPHEFAVPDILFSRELKGELGERLLARGLLVEALAADEVVRAVTISRQRKGLSTPDTFAYSLAQSRGWTLLTGDGGLRALAMEEQLEMHGVLWVFDQLFADGLVEHQRLHTGLVTLRNHPRCRLPTNEILHRLEQYVA